MPSKPKRRVRDPLTEARALHKAAVQWQAEADSLRVLRDQAVRDAVADGHSQVATADAAGISAALVRRILAEGQ